jgi:hypothetical protein
MLPKRLPQNIDLAHLIYLSKMYRVSVNAFIDLQNEHINLKNSYEKLKTEYDILSRNTNPIVLNTEDEIINLPVIQYDPYFYDIGRSIRDYILRQQKKYN